MKKIALVFLCSILISSKCAAKTIEVELDGTYILSAIFVFEKIQISGRTFTYDRSTDEIGDPWSEGFPISGSVKVLEDKIQLTHERLEDENHFYEIIIENDVTYLVREGIKDLPLKQYALKKK